MRISSPAALFIAIVAAAVLPGSARAGDQSAALTIGSEAVRSSGKTMLIAQNKNTHKKNAGKEKGKGKAQEELEEPVNLSKFPGEGSIDAWKESVPEFRAGMDKMKAQRWDEAIAHFKASLALYQFQPRAHLEIGRAIEAKGGLVKDAEESYRNCVRLNSQSWAGWKGLANVLIEQKRYLEAREAVSNGLSLNPPARARQQMDRMVQMINSSEKDANTTGQDAAH